MYNTSGLLAISAILDFKYLNDTGNVFPSLVEVYKKTVDAMILKDSAKTCVYYHSKLQIWNVRYQFGCLFPKDRIRINDTKV